MAEHSSETSQFGVFTRSLQHSSRTPLCKAQQRSEQAKSATQQWFSGAGIKCKVAVANFNGLRGMKAVDHIASGEEFASIPFDACLVVQPAKQCPFPEFCSPTVWRQSPWYVKLALQLLYHKRQGAASRYSHYLADLADITIETPVAWTSWQLEQLHYAHLEGEIGKQRAAWHAHYDLFKDSTPKSCIDRREFLGAMQTVRSRAFSGPYAGPRLQSRAILAVLLVAAGTWSLKVAHLPVEQVINAGIAATMFNLIFDFLMSQRYTWYALCPVIDYCNHSAIVQSNVSYEVFKDCFGASCSRSYVEGEQVFISYGADMSNDVAMQFYNFCIPDNQHDRYIIRQPKLPGLYALDRLELSWDGPTAGTEADLLRAGADSRDMAKAIIVACETEQSRWPTSLQEDRALMQTNNYLNDSRMRLALDFRTQKKELLESCITRMRVQWGD